MGRPQKALSEKEFVRPGRHGARMGGRGIDPDSFTCPSYFTQEHKELWARQLAIFAPSLRPVDEKAFELYIHALIEEADLAKQLYLATHGGEPAEDLADLKKDHGAAWLRLTKLSDKMCSNPYFAARTPELKPQEKGLEDVISEMFR